MAYDKDFPTDDSYLADFPSGEREQIRAIVEDKIVNAGKLLGLAPSNSSGQVPVSNGTVCVNLNADKLDGYDASHFSADGHVHNNASTSTAGFMSAADKTKLDGVATGAEVNQNAFGNVAVGTSTLQADNKQDTLYIAAGSNVSISADETNDKITIGLTGVVPVANGGTGVTSLESLNAGSASKLASKVTLNGNAFDGSRNIWVPQTPYITGIDLRDTKYDRGTWYPCYRGTGNGTPINDSVFNENWVSLICSTSIISGSLDAKGAGFNNGSVTGQEHRVAILTRGYGLGSTSFGNIILDNSSSYCSDSSYKPIGYKEVSSRIPCFYLLGGYDYLISCSDKEVGWTVVTEETKLSYGDSLSPVKTYPGIQKSRLTVSCNIDGNAATATNATKLATARKFSLSGTGLSATAQSFDGTGDITIPITLADALLAIAGITPSAGKIPVFTGTNTASLASITDFMKTLLGKASANDVRSAIGAVDVSGAGVVAGNVSNEKAWWVKLGGTIPLIIQGGYTWVGIRTDVNIAFPISLSHVLGIAGLAVVNSQNSSGRGLEHIKSFSAQSFTYYSGYDIDNKCLTWMAFGL